MPKQVKTQSSRRHAFSEHQRRLFMLLDALFVMNGDDNRELFKVLSSLDVLPAEYYYSYKLDEMREKIRHECEEEGKHVYFGNSNCCMQPRARFELTQAAVKDTELKLKFRRLFVNRTFLSTHAGLAAAQIAAIYNNDEAVFREFVVQDKRTLDVGFARRDHLVNSAFTMEWFESRTPYLKAVILNDLCSAFVTAGHVHLHLGDIWGEYLKGRIPCVWLGPEKRAVLSFWQGDDVGVNKFVANIQKNGINTTGDGLAMGIIQLFMQDRAALSSFNKVVALLKKERGTRQNILTTQVLGLGLNLARFLYGERKDLELMRDNVKSLEDMSGRGYNGFSFGTHGFAALHALDRLRLGEQDFVMPIVEINGYDVNYLSVLLLETAMWRLPWFEYPGPRRLDSWHVLTKDFPRLQRLVDDLLAKVGSQEVAPEKLERDSSWGNLLDLTMLVEEKPEWLMRLAALETLVQESVAEKKKRLVWVVDLEENDVRALEQTYGARGWSKGREVAMKRLAEKSGECGFFTDVDWRIASAVETVNWWRSSNYTLRISECCDALAACDRVFESRNGQLEPIRFREGKLKVVLKEADPKHYSLTFGHDVTGLSSSTIVYLREGDVVTYYKLTALEIQVAKVVGQGMTFPKTELPRVLNLTRSSLKLDVGTEGVDAEDVDEVVTPILQLEQTASGFEAVAGVRPFGRPDTAFFRTGEGPTEPLATVPMEEPKEGEERTPLPVGEGEPGGLTRTLRVRRNFAKELAALDALAKVCPTLSQGLENGQWYSGNIEDVLTLLEELRETDLACKVEWPRGSRLKLRGQLDASRIKARIGWSSNDWFGVEGTALLDDDEMISLSALLASLKGSRFVSLGDGEYVALTQDLRRKLSSLKLVGQENKKGQFIVNSLASAAVEQALEDMEVEVDPRWEANVERMREAFSITPQVPSLLRAELREYQREGYEWMQRLAVWGVGGCLADDMGLGKTLQAIAVMLNQAAKDAALVVAPTSVCGNWELEINRFAPSLNVVRLGTTGREETVSKLSVNDVLVVGYGLLPNVQEELASRKWSMVVFDEAQALKNAATKRAKAGRKIDADFRLALTGTPIENRIDDLWSLFNIINPGLLGSWENFMHRYGKAASPGTPASRALRAVVRPFLLRRLKSAVLDELPEKTEQNIIVEPNDKERAFYEQLRQKAVAKLSNSDSKAGARRIEILAELTRLRRACCHPGLADPDMMALEKYSSKTLQFIETVEDLIASGHKVLAFSQFTTYLAQIRSALEEKNISYQYLDGQTPELERKKRVAAFQSGEGDVFLLSLKAGGTGINLTAADYVIHLDPWWNPAVEDQASDRAHRIGQKRPVTIYRMVQQDSVEERILALHQSKRELAADFLEGTETSVKSLTEDDLLRLMQ